MTPLVLKYSNFNISYTVPHIKQDKSMSCWWAASQMLLGLESSRLMGDLESQVRYYQNTGLPLDLQLFTRYLKVIGLRYISAVAALPSPNVAGWYYVLKKLGPILVTIRLLDTSGSVAGYHAVIVTGLNESGYLQVSDPNPNKPSTYIVDLLKFSNDVCWNHLIVFK